MGKVYIVGAGPGKKELLTLKAYELIKKADVILYDELIGDVVELLNQSKAKLLNVGKRSGKHRMSQEEINNLLVKFSKEYDVVVRLKGGDPFVFGRGGEEAEYLLKNGVDFEVVPGVTSAIAVPAVAGIPVTHRRYDPAFVVITGRESRRRLNWEALAKLNATIVVLMGVGKMREICSRLIENGKDPETPAALIEKGFTKEQRVFRGKLKNIAEISEKENVQPPAVLVIGEVAELSLVRG
ncbi:MAG: uroporphyrinogen-III C-methyltransferase [Archaeoglobaceae archaeon]|nr:uroporphyrinogen-III C-methyltransferase [Archaeoglobaceae archaeon]MCX8152085.1 uroporphyrinogen-III C-methyltransferase [Archaeoglobaceae archaeon]MDW8013520.1 uroporphyrinogen-III C-methyltransferase [Archaeoglobaceae archaeon]